MTTTSLSRSGIHPWDRFKTWVTSTENRLYVHNFPPDLAAVPASGLGRSPSAGHHAGVRGTRDPDHSLA